MCSVSGLSRDRIESLKQLLLALGVTQTGLVTLSQYPPQPDVEPETCKLWSSFQTLQIPVPDEFGDRGLGTGITENKEV